MMRSSDNPHERTASAVLDAAMVVHSRLGPGLLESAYEAGLNHELSKAGHRVDRQVHVPIDYDSVRLDVGYRLDLLVNGIVVVEVKAVDSFQKIHGAQLLSYLRLGNFKLGLMLNFNVLHLRDGIKRVVNKL